MPIIQKTGRIAVITVAGLFIALGLAGVVGVWVLERRAIDATQKAFGLLETAVTAVHAGVTRVGGFIATCQTDARGAAETINTIAKRAEGNGPVLAALGERLETNLTPHVAQTREAVSAVRDAVATIGNVVSLMNSLPMLAERAPRLATLDEALRALEGVSLDTAELRSTLRTLVAAQTSELAAETIATIIGLLQRIDIGQGEIRSRVQEVQADVSAIQIRLEARKSRVFFVLNLLALVVTLILAWMVYSQIVVIRHHRARARSPV